MSDFAAGSKFTIGQVLTEVSNGDSSRVSSGLAIAERQLSFSRFPLYLRILIGVGAVIVGGLLLLALALADVFDYAGLVLVLGTIFVSCSVFLYRQAETLETDSIGYVVLQQLSFVGVFMGKCMLVAGANDIFHYRYELYAMFAVMVAFTLATYWVYDLYLDRLMSCIATLFSGLITLGDLIADLGFDVGGYDVVTPWVLMAAYLLFPLGIYVFLSPRFHARYNPFAVAAVLVAGGFSLVGLSADGFGASFWPAIFESKGAHLNRMLSVLLSVCCMATTMATLVAVIVWGGGGRQAIVNKQVRLAIGLAIGLTLFGITPCILGITVVVIGFLTSDRLIMGVGILYVPVTLFVATHSLAVGLMTSGGILIGMSAVMFVTYLLTSSWFSDESIEENQYAS